MRKSVHWEKHWNFREGYTHGKCFREESTHGKYSERGMQTESTQRGVYTQRVLRGIHTKSTQGYTHENYSERGIRTESTQNGSTGEVPDMEQGKDFKTHVFHLLKVKIA